MPTTDLPRTKTVRSAAIVMVAVVVVIGVYSLGGAGSLTPSVAPAGTLDTVGSVYDTIASAGFDSSGIVADPNGGAFELAKCVIAKMTGGTCP